MTPLQVVCINWKNYYGCGAEYVRRLHNAVKRHLTVPHEFLCLTEAELGTALTGWWVKMLLAQPGRFTGGVLYLDVDLLITANIDHLVALAATDCNNIWMREDFSYPYSAPRQDLDPVTRRLLGGPGCCNSSVMLWHGDAMAPVWERWHGHEREFMDMHHGDQNTISAIMWPDHIRLLPDTSVQSHRYGVCMRGEAPAPIVVFHGAVKPHTLNDSLLVSEHWR